jgi:L-threonine kinase
MKRLTGWARCPGTCGEWVQGAKNGVPFLIGCPVNRSVEVTVELHIPDLNFREDTKSSVLGGLRWALPEGKEKTRKALEKLEQKYSLPSLKGSVHFTTELPTGKGMASSTADMIASMVAVLNSFQIPWEAEELARLALQVEPTDPVMFEGITEFAHRDGSYIKSLGPIIPANLLMMDWGGILDTQVFNARNELEVHYRRNEQKIQEALSIYYEGMGKGDLEKIAYASTMSARCNQEINPKPQFESFLSWVLQNGGLGVVAAHSGTLLAGVFPQNNPQAVFNEIQAEVRVRFQAESVEWVETRNGGVQGGMSHARWKSIGGDGEVRKEFVY